MASRPDLKVEELEDVRIRPVRLSDLKRAPPAALAAASANEADIADQPSAARPAERQPAGRAPVASSASAAGASVPARPAKPASPMQQDPATGRALRTLGYLLLVIALLAGWFLPTERYITPKRGVGYVLGILGGSLMLLLLIYSLRKRYPALSFLGPTPRWFRFHMLLGILGPLCILYHANFRTGATNSNVALFAMLIVAGSGFIGRYLYRHIHNGLYGRKLALGELRSGAESLKANSYGAELLPELVARLERAEKRMLESGPSLSLLGFSKPAFVAGTEALERWRLHRYVRRTLRSRARRDRIISQETPRLRAAACAYVDRRLAATRRFAGFEGYERIFSLWHALHIPLIFMMIFAAIVHVIAVHVY